MFAPLYSHRWWVLRVTLVNTRNVYSREPPAAVFEALFRSAASRQCPPPEELWFYHPKQRLGERIKKGGNYHLEIVFPQSTRSTVKSFASRLASVLENPKKNFALANCEDPEERFLGRIEEETPELDNSTEEICLNFTTPLAFKPVDPSRRWHITMEVLFRCLFRRIEALWGDTFEWTPDMLEGLKVVPCYWDYTQKVHRSKSSGGKQFLNGCIGSLYLKGNVKPWLPLLRICSEVHASGFGDRGQRFSFGAGAYQLHTSLPAFASSLGNPGIWLQAIQELAEEDADPDPFLHGLDREDSITDLQEEIKSGEWQPGTAKGFYVNKKTESDRDSNKLRRLICQFSSRDRVVYRVLHKILAPVWDRLFEASSYGFRPGRSTADARRAVLAYARSGCNWVLEADITSFFDEIDWEILERLLKEVIPEADSHLLSILSRLIRAPLYLEGKMISRQKGLLQGCSLSPLLANLYLDPFDESVARAGLRMVRYSDDFLVLCENEKETSTALNTIRDLLAQWKLKLHPEKLALTPLAAGFQFLGHSFAAELDEEFLEKATLKKPLHVLPDYSFVGLDNDAVNLRRNESLVGRAPLRRVGEIIIHGAHSVSTPLLNRCAHLKIPVTFCTAAGHHVSTLRPDSKLYFENAGQHFKRHTALDETQIQAHAVEIVSAKIGNYLTWIRQSPMDSHLKTWLEQTLCRLEQADDIATLRGFEGAASKRIYQWVNARVNITEFDSDTREPRSKADRWNSLLDFAYTRLFARLNVVLRNRGLNPFLGFLHSAANPFESLVCDLQEAFRFRCDRWAVKLVNRRQVSSNDFRIEPDGRVLIVTGSTGRLLELWEKELDTRVATDAGTFEQLLHAQADAVLEWAQHGGRLRLYRAAGTAFPSAQ